MFNEIFTLDHTAYFLLGGAAEVGGTWAIARIKTLAKNPTASLSADALALIEKLVDKKIAAAVAPQAPVAAQPMPTAVA